METHVIEYVVGDVRSQSFDGIKIIPHCCNDQNLMGSGVAKALYSKWPEVKEKYHSGKMELGKTSVAVIRKDSTIVVNMIAQHGVMVKRNERGIAVGEDGRPPIRYEALVQAMKMVKYHIKKCIENDIKVEVHCPKFGCDLAGGDWDIVSTLIEEMWCPLCNVVCCVIDDNQIP